MIVSVLAANFHVAIYATVCMIDICAQVYVLCKSLESEENKRK